MMVMTISSGTMVVKGDREQILCRSSHSFASGCAWYLIPSSGGLIRVARTRHR